jgi:hypothetical protein
LRITQINAAAAQGEIDPGGESHKPSADYLPVVQSQSKLFQQLQHIEHSRRILQQR